MWPNLLGQIYTHNNLNDQFWWCRKLWHGLLTSCEELSTDQIIDSLINQARIKVLERPSQNPDLNPIENMCWPVLKKQVCVRKSMNLIELHQFCQEEWPKVQTQTFQKLVDGYQKCLTGENVQGVVYQILALLYVYFWPSRFGHIFRRPIINLQTNQNAVLIIVKMVLINKCATNISKIIDTGRPHWTGHLRKHLTITQKALKVHWKVDFPFTPCRCLWV